MLHMYNCTRQCWLINECFNGGHIEAEITFLASSRTVACLQHTGRPVVLAMIYRQDDEGEKAKINLYMPQRTLKALHQLKPPLAHDQPWLCLRVKNEFDFDRNARMQSSAAVAHLGIWRWGNFYGDMGRSKLPIPMPSF